MDITKTFKNVEPKKQKQILNAALKEFTEKGFEQASTNQIVKDAGIGKGMLFYYFTNKKSLYIYLINYCIDVMEREYLAEIDYSAKDIFKRLKDISKVKWRFLERHPDMINFIGALFLKNPDKLDKELNSRFEALQVKWHSILYEDIDFSLFREDIDTKKAFELIQWSIHGYEENLKYRLQDKELSTLDYDIYFDEFFEYLNVLKTAFYPVGT